MIIVDISSLIGIKTLIYAGVIIVCNNQELPMNNTCEMSIKQLPEDAFENTDTDTENK